MSLRDVITASERPASDDIAGQIRECGGKGRGWDVPRLAAHFK